MDDLQIAQVRRFNRLVTRRAGVLDESYLSRGRPLAEARIIFEVGEGNGDLAELRRRLVLDSGYLSRLLRSLEKQGMIEVRAKRSDARARQIVLTPAGKREYRAYDRLSDKLATSILAGLSDARRARLVAAMADVEKLFRAATLEVQAEAPSSRDAFHCRKEYFGELASRFDAGFDPATGGAGGDDDMVPPDGLFVVAQIEGEPVGCGGLKRLDANTGEIKRVWTSATARGLGVASAIMDHLETSAREMGMTVLRLDTNRVLSEAQALYRKRGYVEIERYNDNPYAHHFFEKKL